MQPWPQISRFCDGGSLMAVRYDGWLGCRVGNPTMASTRGGAEVTLELRSNRHQDMVLRSSLTLAGSKRRFRVTQRMATDKVSLKLLVNKSNQTVLFAEAGKDFVDFLFHILALPVGTVIQLLTTTGMVGSLGNLYGSVEKLNDVYIKSSKKDSLLKPKAPSCVSEIPLILPETSSDSTPNTYYRCNRSYGDCPNYVAEDPYAKCPDCNNSMNQGLVLVKSEAGNPRAAAASAAVSNSKGGFVQGVVTYMVMDDLEVKPMSTISSITLLNEFNVKEIGLLEEKVVILGMDEGIKLLRTSFHSKKVLTDVFLGEK
ncbi:hypothetical protein NL676_003939 [Syzygium grande]|nr:hypothetical protein NL676_003939 [Syzygium grande]